MLLTIDNAKTSKGEKLGYLTGILYMLPDKKTCPFAKQANCLEACLVTAGLAGIYKSINEAREKRKEFFYKDRSGFMEQLAKEIESLIKKAKKENQIPVIRLNGTSDIPYENIPYKEYKNIFDAFPGIQFYDYTKISKRLTRSLPKNYDLTFSYSTRKEFEFSTKEAIKSQKRIAVVFRKELPTTFLGREVVDGDKTDLRFLDPINSIVGLKAKGKAIHDYSGFVVDPE
jgi:hypothetical protein